MVFDAIAPAVDLEVGQTLMATETGQFIMRPRSCSLDNFGESADMGMASVGVLVATPGRLMDYISSTKGFALELLCYLVVDETDRLLLEACQFWLPNVLCAAQLDYLGNTGTAETSVFSRLGPITTLRRLGVERGFEDKAQPRVMKMNFCATLTRDTSNPSELALHRPLFLSSPGAVKHWVRLGQVRQRCWLLLMQ